jgi:glycosyltransferase involved in cell wall biosynthesis
LALRARLAGELGIDPSAPIGFFAGRFDPQKDPLLLLRAWQALQYDGPPPNLILAGEGNLEPEMRAFVDSAALGDRIHFAGALGPNDVGHWMNVADVFVMSSMMETMSMAMLEAVACGLPVVAPDLGEAAKLICRPEAGALVGERSVETMTRTIADVLKRPRDRELCASSASSYTVEGVLEPIFSLIRQNARGASQ